MKIAIATPLYPPDIEEPAPFVKEFARRLSESHSVTVLAYGAIPEQVPGVETRIVKKHLPVPLRLMTCTFAMTRLLRENDVVVIENGPSMEVPALVALSFSRTKAILHLGDARANIRAGRSRGLSFVQNRLRVRCAPIDMVPLPKPEILPFEASPSEQMAAYERSWEAFMHSFESLYAK